MTRFQDTLENLQAYVLDQDPAIETQVVGETSKLKRERLDVYREGYALRLLEILEKNFPVLRKLMGEELFEKLGRAYITAYPSHHFSIRYFGRYFSKFLSSSADVQPEYVDVALFEWTLETVMESPDAPQLTFETMSAIPPEAWANLQLVTHPSLQVVPFFYNAPKIWQAVQHETEMPEIKFNETPNQWLIWRFNRQAYFCPVSPEQLWMLNALQSGKSFSAVCEGLCEFLTEEEVTQFAAETLRNWIVEGVFSEYKLS